MTEQASIDYAPSGLMSMLACFNPDILARIDAGDYHSEGGQVLRLKGGQVLKNNNSLM